MWPNNWKLNTLKHGQNEHHFADDNFKSVLWTTNFAFEFKFRWSSVPSGPLTTNRLWVMAYRRTGDNSPPDQVKSGLISIALTHRDRVTHICIGELTIIGVDNGLSPGRRQTIILTSAGILLIGRLGTNFSEILIAIETFSEKKMHLKMSSGRCRPSCIGLNLMC